MRLNAKVALGLLPFMAFSTAVLLHTSRREVHRALVGDLARQMAPQAEAAAAAMAGAFQTGREADLLALLRTARGEAGASYAIALDHGGRVLAHTDAGERGRVYADEAIRDALRGRRTLIREVLYRGAPVLDLAAPVVRAPARGAGHRHLGTLRLGLPLSSTLATEREIASRLLWIVAAGSLASLVFILILIRRLLFPLQELAAAAGRIAQGRYGARIPVRSSDEAGELARRFNEMSASLEKTAVRRDFLDAILRAMPDALFIAGVDGTIRTVNPAACELLGYQEGELTGRPLLFLFPEEDRLLLAPNLSELGSRDAQVSLDLRLRKKSREKVPVIFTCVVLSEPGGGAPSLLCAAKDISERKQAELFLDGQARTLQKMLAGAPLSETLEGIVAQIEGQYPESWAAISVISSGGTLDFAASRGLPAEFLQASARATSGPNAAAYPRLIGGESPIVIPDISRDARWAELAAQGAEAGIKASVTVPVRQKGRAPLGCLTLFLRESRDARAGEVALLDSMAKLAGLALERQASEFELKRSQEQLVQSEKLSAVGQLAAGVAHEINNPLATILGFAQAVSADLKAGDPLSLPLESIAREAKRCRALVSELLTFSRQSAPRREPVDINTVIESTLRLVAARARVGAVETALELRAGRAIDGDSAQLQQVIVNLCNNALDAMPKGGRLSVRTRDTDAPDGRRVVLEVEDNGTGIPASIRDKIFNPFFTTKQVGEGTGLGLALVHEIVARHQGLIELDTEPGRGSRFRIVFPADGGSL